MFLRRCLPATALVLGLSLSVTAELIVSDFSLQGSPNQQILQSLFDVNSLDQATTNPLLEAVNHYRAGEPGKALESFEAARASNSQLPPAGVMLARLFLADAKYDAALQLLEQVSTETPGERTAHLAFGELALATRRHTDALLHFERAKSLTTAQMEAEDDRPKSTESSDDLPSRRPQLSLNLASALSGLAEVAERRQQWEQANEYLQRCRELAPKDAGIAVRLARTEFQLQNYSKAEQTLRQARKLDESLPPADLSLGVWYTGEGQRQQGETHLENALLQSPDNLQVLNTVVMHYLETGQTEVAADLLKQTADSNPSAPQRRYLEGLVARFQGEFTTAEEHFETLHRENPADVQIANQLALVLIEQHDERKKMRAMQLAEVNLRQFPNSPELRATLGWVLFRNGQIEDAKLTLQPLMRGGTISPDAAYFYARVLEESRQLEDALALYESASQAQGLFINRDRCEAKLEELAELQQRLHRSTAPDKAGP